MIEGADYRELNAAHLNQGANNLFWFGAAGKKVGQDLAADDGYLSTLIDVPIAHKPTRCHIDLADFALVGIHTPQTIRPLLIAIPHS